MKKIISILLTAVMLLGLVPVTALAAELPAVTLEADKTSVKPGETVTLTMKLDSNVETTVAGWQWNFVYDSTYFEAVSAAVGDAAQSMVEGMSDFAVTPMVNYENPTTDYADPYACATVTQGVKIIAHKLNAGIIATLTLKAKEEVTENITAKFYLGSSTVMDSSGNPLTDVVTTDAQYAWGADTQTLPGDSVGYSIAVNGAEPAETGYTAAMPADITAVAAETVTVSVTVDHTGDVESYNAFDMSFSYNTAVLELISTEIAGLTVTADADEGTVRVQGYGADRSVGTAPFSLAFKGVGTGTGNVTLTSAKVDISAHAITEDAPEAEISDAVTQVTVTGYAVSLPENFAGEKVAKPNESYTFSEPEDYYEYTLNVTVDGNNVDFTDNGDGTYTVPAESVIGAIKVTVTEKVGMTFDVELGEHMTSEQEKATHGTPYVAKLTREEGYSYEVTVTVDGDPYTSYEVSEGVYTIPGGDITGKIVFTVKKTQIPVTSYGVTFEGTGAGDAQGAETAEDSKAYTFTLNKADGYTYTVSAVMGEDKAPVEVTEENGTYTIATVTGTLVITVEKTAELTVDVGKYVELDGSTVFLVTVKGQPGEGKAYTYDSNVMFYSEVYNAWCWLVIVEEDTPFTAADAKARIAVSETGFTTLAGTYDVNISDTVDINDAQLVYDIYNGKYPDFDSVNRERFLNADVNGDGTVNVTDAAAVVGEIA